MKWRAPSYDGDRRVALSGSVEIGAVFPPIGKGAKWRWRLFIDRYATDHIEKTELAAKTALQQEWAAFLLRADLDEAAA